MGSAQDTLPILMYHSVTTDDPRSDMQVRLPSLRRQLVALQLDGWELTGLSEALALRASQPTRRVVALTFDDGYADFLAALDCLVELNARATLYIPTFHVGDDRLIPEAGRLLTWDELARVARSSVEIGSHSHHHRPMDVQALKRIAREVTVSRSALEDKLGVDVSSFCYPHGYSSRSVRRLVARAGYSNACIVGRRIASLDDDIFALPRLHITDDVSESAICELVRLGDRTLASRVKPMLQPVWRGVRLGSKLMGRELT